MGISPSDQELPVVVEHPAPGVALVRLNRPSARNSLTFESWHALDAALTDCERDDVRCIVLASTGGYFSAGGDLKTPPSRGSRATAPVARLALAHNLLLRLRALPQPVLAAVEGGAVGLGWSLVLACDLIFASSESKFTAPFVARGVVPDGGAGWFLTRRIGRHRASELLFGGRALPAAEALSLGLVTRLVAAGGAEAEAIAEATRLATMAPHALEMTKALIDRAESAGLADYLRMELLSGTLSQLGPEADAARAAFRAKSK